MQMVMPLIPMPVMLILINGMALLYQLRFPTALNVMDFVMTVSIVSVFNVMEYVTTVSIILQ